MGRVLQLWPPPLRTPVQYVTEATRPDATLSTSTTGGANGRANHLPTRLRQAVRGPDGPRGGARFTGSQRDVADVGPGSKSGVQRNWALCAGGWLQRCQAGDINPPTDAGAPAALVWELTVPPTGTKSTTSRLRVNYLVVAPNVPMSGSSPDTLPSGDKHST